MVPISYYISVRRLHSTSCLAPREAFERERKVIHDAYGKKGDYEALATASTLADEAKLKSLRERILQRDSDEAFYDYQKVNDIIMRNRRIPPVGADQGPR